MNAVDILKYGQQTVLQTLEGFPTAALETPGACGTWSVKDIIAHLASYERVLIDILAAFTGGGPTPALDRFLALGDQFNDTEIGHRKAETIDAVLADLNTAQRQAMALVARIP